MDGCLLRKKGHSWNKSKKKRQGEKWRRRKKNVKKRKNKGIIGDIIRRKKEEKYLNFQSLMIHCTQWCIYTVEKGWNWKKKMKVEFISLFRREKNRYLKKLGNEKGTYHFFQPVNITCSEKLDLFPLSYITEKNTNTSPKFYLKRNWRFLSIQLLL